MHNEKPIPITNDMMAKLYEKRVLLFVEQNDGNFYQVSMNRKEFNQMIINVMTIFPHVLNEKTHIAQVELSLGKSIPGKTFEGFENTG